MMKVSDFNYEEHAPEVSKWLEKHQFPLPPEQMLPPEGYMIEDIACGFLYTTDSTFGWIEWVFSNPTKTKEERQVALDLLMALLEAQAKDLGVEVIFSSASVNAYHAILKRNGFMETDRDVTHYVKMLGRETSVWQSVQH